MVRYVEKRSEVGAVQVVSYDDRYSKLKLEDRPLWFAKAINAGRAYWQGGARPGYSVETKTAGIMFADIGDWIVMRDGDLTVYSPGAFHALFEQLPDA